MPFTDLPPELLQLILRYCTTPSLMQLIRTCHLLFDLTEQSRDVVIHHLNNVPGEISDLKSGSCPATCELFLVLRRRAAASLQGVNISADRRDFRFADGAVDVGASSVASNPGPNVVLVQKGDCSIRVYDASDGKVKLRGDLANRDSEGCISRPLLTTFERTNNLLVLYGVEMFHNPLNPDAPVPVEFTLSRLALNTLSTPPKYWNIGENLKRDISNDWMPVSMTAGGNYKVAIAWDGGTRVEHAKYTHIALYSLLKGKILQSR
jgi:hypothetical protein